MLATELVRRGARRHARRTAVIWGEQSLTFREVDEAEEALMAHPAVAGAAVVGAPDPAWVEAVTAFVTLRPGAEVTGAELQAAVRSALAAYKVPEEVHVVDSLPLSPVGTVLRRALREPLWATS